MQFNKYFTHKISNSKTALITDIGNWIALSPAELKSINQGSISKPLQKKLEEKKIILTKKNKSSIQQDYSKSYNHLTHGISLHIINPTMKCNHSCLYCYANSPPLQTKGQEMDLETAKKTIDFIWQSPKKNIVLEFQGGEPLSRFETIQFIMDYAKSKTPKKNIHWRMVSNLSLMDETIAKWAFKNGLRDICTSLDGPAKVHDKNRPMHGSAHKKVVHWIDLLRNDFGFERIGTLCTVTKYSLPHSKEIFEQYKTLGLPDITPVSVREIGRACQNWDKIGYGPQQYLKFWKEILDLCIGETKAGNKMTEQFSLMIAQKFLGKKDAYHTCLSKPCGAALMQASYQPDGSIYTCDEGKARGLFKIGCISQPYAEVFTSPDALNMVSLSSSLGMICNECKWTAYCSFCPVMAYASQGSLTPLLYNNFDCQTKKGQFAHVFEKLFSKDGSTITGWACKGKVL